MRVSPGLASNVSMLDFFFRDPRNRLDIFAGLIDGILNALILSARVLVDKSHLNAAFIGRVSAVAGLTTIVVFFIAHYAETRAELVRAEKQLNLTSHGYLAASRLGTLALVSSIKGAVIAAVCSTLGATVPLVLSLILVGPEALSISANLVLLAVLGAALAKSFHGSVAFWAITVAVVGAIFTWAGVALNLVT